MGNWACRFTPLGPDGFTLFFFVAATIAKVVRGYLRGNGYFQATERVTRIPTRSRVIYFQLRIRPKATGDGPGQSPPPIGSHTPVNKVGGVSSTPD